MDVFIFQEAVYMESLKRKSMNSSPKRNVQQLVDMHELGSEEECSAVTANLAKAHVQMLWL